MYLQQLTLRNFKNHVQFEHTFQQGIQLIVGPNGSGKTNLLDAIHLLSVGRSAFNPVDNQLIHWESDFFFAEGQFDAFAVRCTLERNKRKTLSCQGKAYEKIADHYGRFPVVLIAPYDTDLIREGSQIRRNFFDGIIAQTNRPYLEALVQYRQLLRQRNQTLKQDYPDRTLLETYAQQLLPLNERIAQQREQFVQHFMPLFGQAHQALTQGKESVDLQYRSEVQQPDFVQTFLHNLRRDIQLQRTEKGIHADKYNLNIDGYPLKKFGSQGQQKTTVLALKLAHFQWLSQEKAQSPILLLDDIFDKLDTHRTQQLLSVLHDHQFEQIFVTDATPERSEMLFEQIQRPLAVISTQRI
ncbi:MAG: DNA replication/repair protein RecF [Bernardetiaceae bacterium]